MDLSDLGQASRTAERQYAKKCHEILKRHIKDLTREERDELNTLYNNGRALRLKFKEALAESQSEIVGEASQVDEYPEEEH